MTITTDPATSRQLLTFFATFSSSKNLHIKLSHLKSHGKYDIYPFEFYTLPPKKRKKYPVNIKIPQSIPKHMAFGCYNSTVFSSRILAS